MNKIRKGDTVVVLSGKDKGRQGAVLDIDGDKITVENINKVKKHQKPRQGKAGPVPGGIQEKSMPLHISKVAIWNVGAKKADRVGIKQLNDGKRVRFFKSNGEVIDA
jgi:large subunit ribosomal protein L24